jgi:DNA mismatch repair protein MutL
MSLERHATSKISSFDDLLKVSSMGFRGEALPSIASISYMTLRTRAPQSEISHQIKIEGGACTLEESCAGEPGTTITVEHLFYNVPARRKFLKGDATELKNCVEAVKTLALSHTSVAFRLMDDKRVILDTPADQSPFERITRIFGDELSDDLKEVNYNSHPLPPPSGRGITRGPAAPIPPDGGKSGVPVPPITAAASFVPQGQPHVSHRFQPMADDPDSRVRVYGYASPIGKMFSTRDKIFFFVNRRCVESKIFHRAVRDVYGGALGRGHYPALWIFLEIPPDSVDVNVHPAKKEVRFRSEGDIYQLLFKALSQALLAGTPRPFTLQDPFGPTPFPFTAAVPKTTNGLPTLATDSAVVPATAGIPPESTPRYGITAPLAPSQTLMHTVAENPSNRHGWNFLSFLRSDYVLFATPEGLAVLNIANARERIAYDLVESSFGQAHSQTLLVPSLVRLEPHLRETLGKNQELFSKQGFVVSAFGTGCYRLEAIPDWLTPQNGFQGTPESLFLSELMALHAEESSADATLRHRNACRAAAREAHGTLSRAEAAMKLIDDLLKSRNPLKSPSGEPTFWHISAEELQKRFGTR